MTASSPASMGGPLSEDGPLPLSDEEIASYRDLIELHQQYGPALSIEGETKLLGEVERLRAMKCATCGKRIGYLNHKGYLLGWGCADAEQCEQGLPHRLDTERGEVLVEDSWFKVDDLPDILGNFMRAAAEHGREGKKLAMQLADMRRERDAARSECAALAAKVAELEELKCAVCGMRVAHLNCNGHVIGWGCADGDECKPEDGSGMPHTPAQERAGDTNTPPAGSGRGTGVAEAEVSRQAIEEGP